MKKLFIFASLIAAVAMLASCNNKGDKPKARFDYAVDGLQVTFTNMSKDAESYTWEFGDGTLFSKEENPVHTYAEPGTYTVKLTASNKAGDNSMEQSITLEKKAWEIKIDGKFKDWEEVPEEALALAAADEDSKYEYLHAMAWCADADYLYFYLEFDGSTYDYIDDGGAPAVGFLVDPIDIYMNVDGDETTGSNNYLWENSAADILIEGFWSDNMESAGVYVFPATADQGEWAWVDAEIAGAAECCDPISMNGNVKAIEGRIMIAMLPYEVKKLKVGVFTSTTEWTESGVLPQTTIDGEGVSHPSPLLEVPLAK